MIMCDFSSTVVVGIMGLMQNACSRPYLDHFTRITLHLAPPVFAGYVLVVVLKTRILVL
jgi:hypothetical protein